MNEQGPELKLGALADEQPHSPVRKPWHAPEFMMSVITDAQHGGLVSTDVPVTQTS